MRKELLTMLLAIFCLTTIADKPKTHLVLWAKDGTIRMFSLAEKPKITFTSSELIVTKYEAHILSGLIDGKKEVKINYSLDDMLRFTYESIIGNGDVNGDSKVNILDVTLTISHILGQNPSNFSTESADINGDGKIDFVDITIMIYIILCNDPQSPPVNEGIIGDLNDLLGQMTNNCPKTTIYQVSRQSLV